MSEIWILGATGRCGRAVAAQLAAAQLSPVLVGRNTQRLRELATAIGSELRIVTAGSVDAIVKELARNQPAVVINTVGPFTETALPIARACPPGTHYLDISNELFSITGLLALHDEAVASGRTFVTGAAFGVLATESVVLKLCAGQPPAAKVRVDALPAVDSEPGPVGAALAATIIDTAAAGGRRYAHGRLEQTRLFGDLESLTLPDGSCVKTASAPSADLEAAHRASGASFVVAASNMVPTAPVLRAVLPAVLATLRIPAVANFAKRRIAAIEVRPKKPGEVKSQAYSWTHARVQWESGATREGWLRAGDAMAFTVQVMTEVAKRLVRNQGRPGAYTPGALFGPDLALAAGGQFFLDQEKP